MNMHGPGMWMPKQKSGKNWVVHYTITTDDSSIHEQSRKFRIRDEAYTFINRAKELAADPRTDVASITCKVDKL